MPKIVDYDEQKEKITQAAWRVIYREGVEHASVRKIAKEAKVSSGALQHYFKSQSELLEFAMRRVTEQVEQRFVEVNAQFSEVTLPAVKGLLLALVPVNREQELETEVWLSLTIKAFHDETLNEISRQTHESIYQIILALLRQSELEGLIHPGLDLTYEAQRLHLLLDALSLHRKIRPETMSYTEIDIIVTKHLNGLAQENHIIGMIT